MSQISDIRNPWRDILRREPASFRGVIFHVESGGFTGGRRTVVHEYPKRDENYAEDMGRHARRFNFSGYLIYRPGNNYVSLRTQLYTALDKDDKGMLVHPVFAPGGMLAMCERFTMTESRERGGYTQFEMQFVRAGTPVSSTGSSQDTADNTKQQADAATKAAITAIDTSQSTPALPAIDSTVSN